MLGNELPMIDPSEHAVREEADSTLAKFTEPDGSIVFRQDVRHTLVSRTR